MRGNNGILIISLDFEQYWGVIDRFEAFREALLGERSVIPNILELFTKYQVHATWATVGLLFFESKDALLKGLPNLRPQYLNETLSPYYDLENRLGANEHDDPLHYAPSLIKMIAATPYQEIATHTFSHYYCYEKGQNVEQFKADLQAAKKVAQKYNVGLQSIVFPRNETNPDYLPICRELDIQAYRGNPSHWIYRVESAEIKQNLIIRRVRFLNLYFNILGHEAYSLEQVSREFPFNIRASRYLRPYIRKFRLLEPLRMRRIKSDLTYAAKRGLVYHLWWHPYDFGVNQEENLSFLERILTHFQHLKQKYGMESLNMRELSSRLSAPD